jgi:thiol-disulfide isomerase/thioredoxin
MVSIGLAAAVSWVTTAAVAAAQSPEPVRTPSASEPVTSPGNAQWAATLAEARDRAAREKKLVFIEMDAPECGNCRRMDALLYPALDFEALLIGMVPVKVYLPASEGREVAGRYGIRDTPAVLITTPEGRIVFRMQGFLNTRDFYEHVRPELARYNEFAKKIESQDVSRLSASEALETGSELYSRSDPENALPRLRRAASHPKATAAQRDAARETIAGAELDMGDTAGARKTIDRLIVTTKDPERRERAELFRAQLPLAENKPDEAVVLFKKFQKDHPNSSYNEQVTATLQKLAEARKTEPKK